MIPPNNDPISRDVSDPGFKNLACVKQHSFLSADPKQTRRSYSAATAMIRYNEWCNLKLCLWIYYSSVLRKLRRNLKKVNQYVCLSTAKTSLKSSPPPFFRPNVFGICDLNLLEARAKIGHITSYNIAVFWSREKPCSIRLLGVFAVSCDRYDLGHNLRIQNNRRLVSTARTFGIDRLYADRSNAIAFM